MVAQHTHVTAEQSARQPSPIEGSAASKTLGTRRTEVARSPAAELSRFDA
jgi:hypothetical protein